MLAYSYCLKKKNLPLTQEIKLYVVMCNVASDRKFCQAGKYYTNIYPGLDK